MLGRIAVAASLSFVIVATIAAIYDYAEIVYHPVSELEWQEHYISLAATPIDVTTLAYGEALLAFLRSPILALTVAAGTGVLLVVRALLTWAKTISAPGAPKVRKIPRDHVRA